MQISFIIPVLNERGLLRQQLQCLQGYRDTGHEVILVDGGSKDGSASGISSLVDRVDIAAPGRAAQMNRGAELASGDILVFLHVDTELPESVDRLLLEACERAQWGWFDVNLDASGWSLRLISTMMNWRSRITAVCTGDQALFVKRELFLRLGGFPSIALMEDIAFSKQLRRQSSPRAISVPVRTSARRWLSNGVLATILQMWFLRLRYFLGASPQSLAKLYYPAKTSDFPHSRIVIFAREPILGSVKTRLAPAIGEQAALDLYKSMATRVISRSRSSGLAEVELWVSSNIDNKYFLSICNKRDIYLQSEGDLGAKMASAMAEVLRRQETENLILIGTDCPAIDYDYLQEALYQLNSAAEGASRVVVGPAQDGGYVLIGMNRNIPGLFEGIKWGSASVLEDTLGYLKRGAIDYHLLAELWDVDRAEDLQALAGLEPPIRY